MPSDTGHGNHSFGPSFRQNSNNRELKCSECLEPKNADNLETDGNRYICDDCLEESDE